MLKMRLAGTAARVWFCTVIASAILLSFFAFHAHAAYTSKPQDGRSGNSGGVPQEPPAATSIHLDNEEVATNFNNEVRDRVAQNGGQYIFGREQEADDLRQQLIDSDAHVVAVLGEPKSGRTGVIDQFVQMNPDFVVKRLNLKKLSLLNEVEATVSLKRLILEPEFWFAWSEFHPNTEVYVLAKAHKP